jgi:hypothetical protein
MLSENRRASACRPTRRSLPRAAYRQVLIAGTNVAVPRAEAAQVSDLRGGVIHWRSLYRNKKVSTSVSNNALNCLGDRRGLLRTVHRRRDPRNLAPGRSGYSRRHFICSIAARLRRFTTSVEGTQRPPWSTNLGAAATMVARRAGGPRAGASANSARAR